MELNDNSDDFDSFFNTKPSKTSTKQKSLKTMDSVEDLFGLEEKTDSRNPVGRKTYTSGIKSFPSKAGIRAEVEEDDDLGFDPKKPKALGKTLDFFDDLLGPLEKKTSQTSAGSNTKTTISRQSTDTNTDASNILQTQTVRPKTSQGRRTSNMSIAHNPDPLELFTRDRETSKTSLRIASPKTQKRGATSDWLGLTKEPQTEAPKTEINLETPKRTSKTSAEGTSEDLKRATESNENETNNDNEPDRETQEEQVVELFKSKDAIMNDSTSQNLIFMNTLNLETQQNFSNLKYQEQQLVMASQMKQQEQVLMDMQHKQDLLLHKQEQQFQKLFQQQMLRHLQLEDLIKQQQQRINKHLQLMLIQPPLPQTLFDTSDESSPTAKVPEAETPVKDLENEKHAALELLQFQSENKRLELENLRLEELIANTRSNFEREIELLERSYKKQMEVLEEQFSSIEKRFKTELEDQQAYFQNKIQVLEKDKNSLKKSYEEELTNLRQDYEDDLRKLRKNQEEDLEMLKEEHRRMIDNIRQAKILEFSAVQENGSYLDYLKLASNNLQDLTGGLKELKENMQDKIEILHLEREKQIEQREKKIEDRERRLKITEESNDLEKQRLMELVSNLELQMSKMSKTSEDENWQLRKKLASLDAEKLAFNKEKEHFHQQLLKDEDRIKYLKEQQLLETQNLQVQLQEERAKLQIEKSKFEMEKRLHNNADVQNERLEVEAAMQVAQDAAHKADMERERFYKMQRQLEQQKRDLNDREHVLNVREEELQQELLSYRMADRMAQEAQQKAKLAEQFYQNKIQLLQQRSNEISEKEANLSQERLLLAQDRIALHALKSKLSQQTKCALCKLSQKNQEVTHSLQNLPANNNANPQEFRDALSNDDFLPQINIVDHLLDLNIADSLRKMHFNSNVNLEWDNLLDDDHKKMVQNDEYEISHNNNLSKTN